MNVWNSSEEYNNLPDSPAGAIIGVFGFLVLVLLALMTLWGVVNEKDVCDPDHPDYSFFVSEGACDYP